MVIAAFSKPRSKSLIISLGVRDFIILLELLQVIELLFKIYLIFPIRASQINIKIVTWYIDADNTKEGEVEAVNL